jgi:hypothetical protein
VVEEEVLDQLVVLQIHKRLLDLVVVKVVEEQVLTLVLMLVLDLNHHNHKVFLLQIICNMEILVEQKLILLLTAVLVEVVLELLELQELQILLEVVVMVYNIHSSLDH